MIKVKKYTAIIAQSGTDNPTATIFNSAGKNYIGNIIWTREDVGRYRGTLNGVFAWQRTLVFLGKSNNGNMLSGSGEYDTNSVIIQTGVVDAENGQYIPFADSVLDSIPIKIEVYQ